MIGSTTTFYDDSLQAPQPEPESEYTAFLEQFPQQTQYHEYNPLFSTYPSQPLAQPNQYLPTPSVSPTSTSGRQITAVPRQSPTQYYTLHGAIEHHQEVPELEAANPSVDRTRNVGKRERAGPIQRRKPQAKAPPKAAAPRKRPRKSGDGTVRGSPEESDEEDTEEKAGEEPKQTRL